MATQLNAPADATVPTLPSGVERARRRSLERRLPEPTAGSISAVGKLVAGRVKLPEQMRSRLGWAPGTELVVGVHGRQLLVAARTAATEMVGAPSRVDATGRLALTDGQRQLLGVSADDAVLLSAEVSTGVLRVVDPARIHALLAEITPLTEDDDDAAGRQPAGDMAREHPKLTVVNGDMT